MSVILFSPEQLAVAAKTVNNLVPDGHTNAVVGTVDSSGAQVLLTMKRRESRWVATAIARHDWTGDNALGASVVYSW